MRASLRAKWARHPHNSLPIPSGRAGSRTRFIGRAFALFRFDTNRAPADRNRTASGRTPDSVPSVICLNA